MNPEIIAGIADYIDTLNYRGFDFFGYSIPESLHDVLEESNSTSTREIFNKLYKLNVDAVNGRYHENYSNYIDMPRNYTTLYHFKTEYSQPWEYQLLKYIACFNYQTSEDATIDNPLHKAMIDLQLDITKHIVWHTPEMNAAQWG